MRNCLSFGVLALLTFAPSAISQDAKPDVKAKLEAHRGGVGAIAFAPNGEMILTGSGNGLARLWDTKTGEMIVKLDSVGGSKIVHAGFSADGSIMSITARKGLLAWSLAEPKNPKYLFEDAFKESIYRVGGVSGDGRRVYYSDLNADALNYHDVKNNTAKPTEFKTTRFTPMAFATAPDADSSLAVLFGMGPDGKTPALVFVGLGDTWTLSEGLKAPDTNPNTVSFSPDGKWLVLCSCGAVQVWKVPGSQKVSGKPRSVLTGTAAAAGPGNVLAVAEKVDGKVRVQLLDLTPEEPKTLTTFATNIEDVSCLAFSADGKMLAVGDHVEGVVQLWALPTKK